MTMSSTTLTKTTAERLDETLSNLHAIAPDEEALMVERLLQRLYRETLLSS